MDAKEMLEMLKSVPADQLPEKFREQVKDMTPEQFEEQLKVVEQLEALQSRAIMELLGELTQTVAAMLLDKAGFDFARSQSAPSGMREYLIEASKKWEEAARAILARLQRVVDPTKMSTSLQEMKDKIQLSRKPRTPPPPREGSSLPSTSSGSPSTGSPDSSKSAG